MAGLLASRIQEAPICPSTCASIPNQSINFVTCHDGLTLNDFVSYNHKHNLANGEENRDGTNDNYSSNYGVEGPSGDPQLEKLRARQIKKFRRDTFLSQGTPICREMK